MPDVDNSAQIAALQAILNSGTKSGMADGEAVTFDPDSIRQQIRDLRATDTTLRGRRPFASSLNFGGSK